jgi:hypothetical protein
MAMTRGPILRWGHPGRCTARTAGRLRGKGVPLNPPMRPTHGHGEGRCKLRSMPVPMGPMWVQWNAPPNFYPLHHHFIIHHQPPAL